MTKPTHRIYSRQNLEALELLGQMIRVGRIDRKMTAQEMPTARVFLDRYCADRRRGFRVARSDPSSRLP